MQEEVEYIAARIEDEEFKGFGLLAEVIAFAIQAMKENSSLTIQQTFEAGCYEWDV